MNKRNQFTTAHQGNMSHTMHDVETGACDPFDACNATVPTSTKDCNIVGELL